MNAFNFSKMPTRRCPCCGTVIALNAGHIYSTPIKKTPEAVDRPAHYQTEKGVECIDAIEAALTPEQFAGFCMGNALKYLWRAGKKGSAAEDLAKADWYITHIKSKMK